MAILHAAQDERGQSDKHPIAAKKVLSLAIVADQEGFSAPFSFNAHIGQLLVDAPTLVTDTTYTIEVRNKDGAVYHTEAAIAHNSKNLIIIPKASDTFTITGSEWTIRWSFPTTNQTLDAGLFTVMLTSVPR